MTRIACQPTPSGCGRCQSAKQTSADAETWLLLGAHNDHAFEAATRALTLGKIPYRADGQVLTLPTARRRMPALQAALDQHVSPFIQASIRAVFFQGDLECASSTLGAFVDAEPLLTLLARQKHEWVRDALNDGWLFSVFHPIVDAQTLAVHGYEALIRARHPETQDVIGAGQIIGACEALQMEHVLDQRARQTAIREASTLGLPDGRFFINFLPNTIYDPEICLRTTMEAAAECRMDVSRLVFEVVETENIPDMKRLKHILDYYRARGVSTAVDDMGAGYSSIEYLTTLHPDYVKLDRLLVVEAEYDKAARQKMADITATAKTLDIKVIAEGIETPSQREICQEVGADFLQGFLFARPANPPQTVISEVRTLALAA